MADNDNFDWIDRAVDNAMRPVFRTLLIVSGVLATAGLFLFLTLGLGGCDAAKHLQYIEIPAVDMEMLQQQYGIRPCPEDLPNRVLAGAEIHGDNTLRIAVGCRP